MQTASQKALAELVKPFNGVIDALLNGGSIVVAEGLLGENAITIEGENGYINAIKPLLTVLGCNTNGIKDGHATVEAILKSLLGRVNEILANPVDEIVALIPHSLLTSSIRAEFGPSLKSFTL